MERRLTMNKKASNPKPSDIIKPSPPPPPPDKKSQENLICIINKDYSYDRPKYT